MAGGQKLRCAPQPGAPAALAEPPAGAYSNVRRNGTAMKASRPPAIRIRTARATDADAIVALIGEVFERAAIDARIAKRLGGAPWLAVKGAGVRRQLADNPAGCFVAESGGRIVGVVTTSVNRVASRGWIIDLAVSSACQGRGLGRRLLVRALAHFRRLRLHHAKIETLDTNLAGQHLYPQLGFVEVARQVHYAMPLRKRAPDGVKP